MININTYDFEYDGEYLSDWGYIICGIDDLNNIKMEDSNLTFNTTSMFGGKYFGLTSSKYENRIEFTFQICKNFFNTHRLQKISAYEISELKRWLNRSTFNKFKFMQQDWNDVFLIGSFNISSILFEGNVLFLELNFIANTPFALHETISKTFEIQDINKSIKFYDISDEIGYIYPNNIEIICLSNGNLEITNKIENRKTIVNNCKKGEIITFSNSLTISSSIKTHYLQNDFNYKFFRIANTYKKRENEIISSIPIKLTFSYNPIVKAVI